MPTIKDVSIIDSNKAKAKAVKSGLERTMCSPSLCGSKNLTVYRRTIAEGKQLDAGGGKDYHLVYVMQGAGRRARSSSTAKAHAAEEGAGVLLVPGESAKFDAQGRGSRAVAHGRAEAAGRGGGRSARRARLLLQPQDAARLSDASGGRVRRFCAESSVRLLDGSRLDVDERDPGRRDALQGRRRARRTTCTKARERIPRAPRTAT